MPDQLRDLLFQLAAALGSLLLRFLGWVGDLLLQLAVKLGELYALAIIAWLPPEYARILAAPEARTAPLFLIMIIGMWWLRAWGRGRRRRAGADGKDKRPLRRRRQPLFRRLNLWLRSLNAQPFYWQLSPGGPWWLWWLPWFGPLVASLNQTHGLAVGGSGSGKSTLVVQLILQPIISLRMWLMRKLGHWKRRPVVIISFDRSDPIEEATNVLEDAGIPIERWRVRQSNGWSLLEGDIEMIAEALPDGWMKAEGDTGFFRQLCSDSIAEALRQQDAAGISPRDFNDMIERMDAIMADDPEIPVLARRTWVRRFRSLARVMGESLGSDFNLVEAAKAGKVVHLSSNSYTNPAITPLVGAMGITHVKLMAEQVSGGYLVLEEAAFLKNRTSVLEDLARSMRARGWRIIYLSQDPNDVGSVLQVNFGVAVFMGLGPLAQKAREWCASVVKGFPGAFRAEELVLYATIDALEGYVLMNGRCRDVSLPPYITRAAEHRPAKKPKPEEPVPASRSRPPGASLRIVEFRRDGGPGQARPGEAESVEGVLTAGDVYALGPGKKVVPTFVQGPRRERRLELWNTLSGTWDENACHLWTSKSRNREYGKTSYLGVSGWNSHFLFWAWRVIEDREVGRAGDLERCYEKWPELPRFEWPETSNELVILKALKDWMAQPFGADPYTFPKSDPRFGVKLEIDHACPGWPNTLCQNYRHHRLIPKLRNGQLRWERRTGDGRLAAEAEAGV